MPKNYKSRAAELGAILALTLKRPRGQQLWGYGRIGIAVGKMQAYTRSAKAAAINDCNYASTERQQELARAKLEKREKEINALLKDIGARGCSVKFGGDPRGACGKLHIAGHAGDDWGDGFAIYD